ncbi:MAG: hypothetical protein J6N51_12465 [Selenomonas sp.]|nr:hypothetical protein [Selenomonas sp.]
MDKYTLERDGQIDFYKRFLPRVNPSLTIDDILDDNNDGVLNGNLLEFKLRIPDLNSVLFQCIKYLSAMRVKGKPVPAGIHLIDLNAGVDWYFESSTYLADIEKLYSGGASKDNSGFIGGKPVKTLNYGNNDVDAENLIMLLKQNSYTKIHIDENCIVGWATSFYKAVPTARKEDFIGDDTGAHKTIGEIRKPKKFSEFIYPYTGETNVKFNYLMDKLNDTLQKKNLGAFYTHKLYAEKALELVRKAIARVPEGNDYIILDRCAGTGNLENGLSDDELSHVIVSTVEYYEYKVLQELLGSKVRHIIPPTETNDTFNAGLVTGADALSKEYLENPVIKQYLENTKCTIILFENPPYSETTSIEHQKRKAGKTSFWKQSYIMSEMKKDKEVKGSTYNDLSNLFIWSAFKYYLRQPTDSYIVFSPIKYWKTQHLISREFLGGFAFNRRHFHTNIDACVMCALWGQSKKNHRRFSIRAYDIDKEGKLKAEGTLSIKRIYSIYSQKFYEKGSRTDDIQGGIFAEFDGTEADKNRASIRIRPLTNDNIIAYLVVKGANFDNPDSCVHLLTVGAYDANGFYVRRDNFLEKLPMFCASRYITYNREWTERARIMKSADGAEKYKKALSNGKLEKWLLKSLLFTCLEMQNHMRTFTGSDGRFYKNELCLDGTNGETLAISTLKAMDKNEKEKELFEQWNRVLACAKDTSEYNSSLTYGVYQIFAELDTSYKDEKTGETVYNNVELHTALQALKGLVKDYYNAEIVPTLFEYEFLK